jgi:hypothetical protein
MTKVMFQVGLLGFFVSALYFGTQGMPLLDMVLRSFIVFIAIVLVQAVIFVIIASMKKTKKSAPEKPRAEHRQASPVTEPHSQQTGSPS